MNNPLNNPLGCPPKEEYLLEKLLRNVLSAASANISATPKRVYVIPNGDYTALFLAALKEAGFSYQLVEPEALGGPGMNGQNGFHPLADLPQALNPRRWKKSLAELLREVNENAVGRKKVVRVIPSEQTPLLLEVLEKEGIPYYLAQPKSFFKPEQEYEINLLELELVMER